MDKLYSYESLVLTCQIKIIDPACSKRFGKVIEMSCYFISSCIMF